MAPYASNYYLLQLTNDLDISDKSELKIQKITANSQEIFKFVADKSAYPEIYCFDNGDDVTSSQELNFNGLKKCSACCTNKKHKFLVLNLEEKHIENAGINGVVPNNLNKTKPTFSFELKNSDSDSTVVKFDGKLLAILHQGYTPTNTN